MEQSAILPPDAAYVVTDQKGRVAMFVERTVALLYAAKMHGLIAGPMSIQKARELVDACAVGLYGKRGERG